MCQTGPGRPGKGNATASSGEQPSAVLGNLWLVLLEFCWRSLFLVWQATLNSCSTSLPAEQHQLSYVSGWLQHCVLRMHCLPYATAEASCTAALLLLMRAMLHLSAACHTTGRALSARCKNTCTIMCICSMVHVHGCIQTYMISLMRVHVLLNKRHVHSPNVPHSPHPSGCWFKRASWAWMSCGGPRRHCQVRAALQQGCCWRCMQPRHKSLHVCSTVRSATCGS